MTSASVPPPGVEFRRPQRALRNLAGLAEKLSAEDLAAVGVALRRSPDPDAALERLERFVQSGEAAAAQLRGARRRIGAALTVFAFSAFLSELLMRQPELLGWALAPEQFDRGWSAAELRADLGVIPPAASDAGAALRLARFRRMHLLRIALRDLVGGASLADTALELSNLADAALEGAHDFVRDDLARRFGRPLTTAGEAQIESRFAVIALGKLGGRELNYSSDIDLLYLHTGDGRTAGPVSIPNREFHDRLAQRLTAVLSQATPEGFAYRVDLRLRPEGSAGELVAPLRGAVDYYHSRARDWELQMLIKARPAAGDRQLARQFLDLVRPLIYRTTTDFALIERVAESRDRIRDRPRRPGRAPRADVKLDRGGIRDIEFLVQCLQRLHGGADAFARGEGTLLALHRLCEKNYLTLADYGALSAAYRALRHVEHRLQLVDDRQTHELPAGPEELERLARRLAESPGLGTGDGDVLRQEIAAHCAAVARIYERAVHAQAASPALPSDRLAAASPLEPEPPTGHRRRLRQLALRRPALAAALDALPIRRGEARFERLVERALASEAIAARLEARPALIACVGDIVEHATGLGEHLIRFPDDLDELSAMLAEPDWPADAADAPPEPAIAELDAAPEAAGLADSAAAWSDRAALLRRIHRRRQFRLLAGSVHRRRPIFATLARLSDLAEWAIRAAYRIAFEASLAAGGERPPRAGLQIVALGRLGMREFDLGSDADLVFAADDDGDLPFWRDFAARFIAILASYTSDGRIFAVDARLRPMGRDGALVQSAAAVKRYFAERAEAWEALAFLKARAVAGDPARGRAFVEELQRIGWRRFGRAADLAKHLRETRARIEQEQGPGAPLKAGPGGYYDIDFLLLYLRLRDADVFYERLSTPRRIAVAREAGGLDDGQARFLGQAAVFFRALDHAIRVETGRPGGALPAAPAAQAALGELLARWSGSAVSGQPLDAAAEEIRRRARRLYREILRG